MIDELQLEEEAVAVIDMSDGFPESIGGIGKVNFDVGGVLVLGEFLCDSGLAYASSSFDKESGSSAKTKSPPGMGGDLKDGQAGVPYAPWGLRIRCRYSIYKYPVSVHIH